MVLSGLKRLKCLWRKKWLQLIRKAFLGKENWHFPFPNMLFCSRDYCTNNSYIYHQEISQSLALCAFLISCDVNYPQVSRISISVLTVTISNLRNLLLIHWVKCLPIMVKLRKNNIVEHVMLLCHLIKTHFPVSGSLVLISVMSTF